MIETGYFLVTQNIAQRCGSIDNYHRTADGRYVVTSRHLSRVTFSPKEYLTGLKGVTEVSREEALKLIKANNFKKGFDPNAPVYVDPEELKEMFPEEENAEEEPQGTVVQEEEGETPEEVPTENEEREEEENTEESINEENKEE